MFTMTNTRNNIEEMQAAMRYLASRCDGAHADDGVGFNGLDADFGHSLAKQPRWSIKQAKYAFLMLSKYNKQLNEGGFDYSSFTAPVESEITRTTRKNEVYLENNKFIISFSFDASLKDAVKEIPDRRWDPDRKVWTAPRTSAIYVEEFVRENNFYMDSELEALLDKERETNEARIQYEEEVIAASKAADSDILLPVKGLRGFQKAGVAYMLDRRRCFNADEQGLGKTVQALTALEADKAFPALIIVPNTMKLTWGAEIKRWLPHRTYQVMDSKAAMRKADITVVNYELVGRRAAAYIGKHRSLVLDESHFVKNSKAKRTASIAKIAAKLKGQDPLVLMLSGTPLVNRPMELLTQLEIMDRIEDFGGKHKYKGRYGSGENGNELNVKLRSTCMVRRVKSEVLAELPPRTFAINYMSLSNEEEYRRAQDKFLQWLEEVDPDRLTSAIRCEALVRINILRRLAARGKVGDIVKWCHDFFEDEQKLVLFAHHSDVVDGLAESLSEYNPRVIKGGTPMGERQEFVEEFQNDTSARLMVLSLNAGKVGLTLTAASNVAFAELGWTPADMVQAVDRCHRIGQQDAVTGWQLIAENSIDFYMAELLRDKKDIMDQILDGKAPAEASESILDDLIRMMKS